MQFKRGELVKHRWAYGSNVYVLLDDNCGHPEVIGSKKGFVKVHYLFHDPAGPSYQVHDTPIRYVSRLIVEREWCYADEKEE